MAEENGGDASVTTAGKLGAESDTLVAQLQRLMELQAKKRDTPPSDPRFLASQSRSRTLRRRSLRTHVARPRWGCRPRRRSGPWARFEAYPAHVSRSTRHDLVLQP
jgi:hypothetical protein